jgi:uncharacterized protein (TIGR03435 family)
MALATVLAIFPAAKSQVSSTSPEFDAASMKLVAGPSGPGAVSTAMPGGARGTGGQDGVTGRGTSGGFTPVRRIEKGRVDLESIGIRELVLKAFGVPDIQVVWPEWVSNPRKAGFPTPSYNIMAVMPQETTDEQLHLMLQNLLKKRLNLVAHREQKDLPTYDITVAGGGLRMREVKPETQYPITKWYRGEDGWRAEGIMHIEDLALSLRRWIPAVDKTGLTGFYDVNIRWDWPALKIVDHEGIENKPSEAELKTLFATMEKTLGLKMEPHASRVNILVIDHLEHIPTED